MTMSGVLLKPDTSTLGGVPLTVLGQEDNIMAFICKSRGETSELSGKIIVRKKDPHLDPCVKLTGKEVTLQTPADTEGEASQVFFAQHRRLAWCQAHTKP